MAESRQEMLDRAARMMPVQMLRSAPPMPSLAEPTLFFKSFGWFQWRRKKELSQSEVQRFNELYNEAYQEFILTQGSV